MCAVKPHSGFNPNGPAVQMGTSTSIFPLQLAEVWRDKGLDVNIVARDAKEDHKLANGTNILSVRQHNGFLYTKVSKNFRILYPFEDLLSYLFRRAYNRSTGQQHLLPGQAHLIESIVEAFPTAKLARSLVPRFVFGHDALSYGLATAMCKGIPKILFPWGSEIFMGAETSPIAYHLIRYSLHSADLVIPSSETAAEHIRRRFEVPTERVHAVSWGVDNKKFTRAGTKPRRKICEKYGISPEKIIVTNPRRFRPTWGCFVALEAFIRLALEHPALHFIMLGGLGTEKYLAEGRAKIAEKGLSDRFTLLDGDIPLDEFAGIMSISEIFVSLLGLGDMRSSSVLQGISAGAVPVISDNPEYRQIAKKGFSGLFVRPDSSEDVYESIRSLLESPQKIAEMSKRNHDYVSLHEDSERQMELMLQLITNVCSTYESKFR